MWQHPTIAGLGKRLLAASPDSGVAPAALINLGPIATVAAVQDHRPGRC
jgi:hypothetical protein